MCGRYYVKDDLPPKLGKLIGRHRVEGVPFRFGDITPTMSVPILRLSKNEIVLQEMTWGIPKADGKGLIINARAESVREKSGFKDAITAHRVLIPASGFYEWDKSKNQVNFTDETGLLFLAGFFQFAGKESERRTVILTTAANDSMIKVHDRMPLMIRGDAIEDWLRDNDKTDAFLKAEMPLLQKTIENEQLSLF